MCLRRRPFGIVKMKTWDQILLHHQSQFLCMDSLQLLISCLWMFQYSKALFEPSVMDCSSEERQMEVEALKSIYGEQFYTAGEGTPVQPYFYEVKVKQGNTKICLIFTIPEKYPDVPPSISIKQDNQPVYTELESLLYSSAQRQLGGVMIYNLVEEAASWIHKQTVSEEIPSRSEKSPSESAENICKFFLERKCRFGSKCRNKHEGITISKTNNVDESLHSQIPDVNAQKLLTTAAEHEKVSSGTTLTSARNLGSRNSKTEPCTSKKKPPMKTASDVISRIMWDDELQPKDFTVGYLDRFTGIVEKGFGEFSWEDPASVDHFVDLAIPRHRIQYFKYLGEIVWDKRERIDKVFGSTGSSETILSVKERIGESNENEDSSVKDSEHVSEADQPGYTVSNLHKQLNENVPNYFIAVQISNPQIINSITKIQNVIQSKIAPEAQFKFIPSQRLHLTLLVLKLDNEDDVTTAKNILKSVQPVLVSILPPSHKLRFNGVGWFDGRVFYASVGPDEKLSKLVQVLKFKFSRASINLEGNRDDFVPHVTIMKGTSNNFRVNDDIQSMLSNSVKADNKMGEQSVHSLDLFSRFLPRDVDGSYHKILSVENSLKSLSSTLPKKLLQRLNYLFESGKLCDDERNEIKELIQSEDAANIDSGMRRLAESKNLSEDKIVLIMRGIQGSGKTHLVENSVEAVEDRKGFVYCSAKQLFHRDGSSSPDAAELNVAEAYCRSCFMEAMVTDRHFVVVDGIYSNCWQYAVYKYVAAAFGFTCHVLEIRVTKPEDIKMCLQHADPGIEREQLLDAVQHWEDDPEAIVIEPWFKNPIVSQHKSISLKEFFKTF